MIKTYKILMSFILLSITSLHASGFEEAFKQQSKKKKTAAFSRKEQKKTNRTFTMRPEVKNALIESMKKSGTFEQILLESASNLIKVYQDKHSSLKKDDLIPHLRSVQKHLNEATTNENIVAMRQEINKILQ